MANKKDLEAAQAYVPTTGLRLEFQKGKGYLFVAEDNPEEKAWVPISHTRETKTGDIEIRGSTYAQKFPKRMKPSVSNVIADSRAN